MAEIITPSGLPTELTEITNGDTLVEVYNPDTGQNEKTKADTIKQYILDAISGSIILDVIFPIGKRVIQLPGESSPATLYVSQTWTNISSTFAGDFFRVEGGKANAYDSGEQEDAMQRITGTLGGTLDSDVTGQPPSGVFSVTHPQNDIWTSGGGDTDIATFNSANSTSPNPAKTDDDETRPVNWTIRIWERTA